MTPAQALAVATSNAARLCELQDVTGRVATGRLADLVVVEGSPTELHGLRERIRQVRQCGQIVVGS